MMMTRKMKKNEKVKMKYVKGTMLKASPSPK